MVHIDLWMFIVNCISTLFFPRNGTMLQLLDWCNNNNGHIVDVSFVKSEGDRTLQMFMLVDIQMRW